MPDFFLRKVVRPAGIELPSEGDYGCGIVFLPSELSQRNEVEEGFEHIIR